jgi:ABC-type antimicrobial peptide transport system permease subunit
VRIALGATSRDVGRLVLAEAFGLVSVGAVLGLALGSMTTRLLRGLLFEVQPLDPIALTGTVFLLLAVAGMALYLPVRHAVRLDPTEMLRSE